MENVEERVYYKECIIIIYKGECILESIYWRSVYWRICTGGMYTGEGIMESVYWRMQNGACILENV